MRSTLHLLIVVLISLAAVRVQANDFYHRMGRGGASFDGPSGSLQTTIVGRSRMTGRLVYMNQYVNPWTGARYATASRFNPYTGRYQTVQQFRPPPPPVYGIGVLVPAQLEEETQAPPPKRGIKVIEVKQDTPPALPVEPSQSTSKKTMIPQPVKRPGEMP